jgi:hypothetical protein
MPRMSRLAFLLVSIAIAVSACSLAPDKQWLKPGQSYTVADFRRDEVACTKARKLDEECMRQRGWVALSGDAAPKPKTLEEQERERRQQTGSGIKLY